MEDQTAKIGLFNRHQWLTLIWTSRISALMSIFGSTLIIYMILRRRKIRLALIHNRLIFGMCCMDILNSAALSFNTAASPHDQPNAYASYGTKETCTAQGFFITLGFGVPCYNACLCIYYLATIRYNAKEDTIKKYEPYMHSFAVLVPLISATLCVIFDQYRFSGMIICFLSREAMTHKQYMIAGMSLVLFMLILLVIMVVSMGLVYLSVRNQTNLMEERYESFGRGGSIASRVRARRDSTNLANMLQPVQEINNDVNNSNNGTTNNVKRETASQAFLYLAAYICTYIISIIVQITRNKSFALVFLISLFLPLQGFWNLCAFMRPKYVALRKRNTSKAILWVIWATVFSSLDEEEERRRSERRSQRRRSSFLNRIMHSRTSHLMQRICNHSNHPETSSPRHDAPQDEEAQHSSERGRDDMNEDEEETREECSGYDIENGNDVKHVNQDFEVEFSTHQQESKKFQNDSNSCYKKIDDNIQVGMKDVGSSAGLDVSDSNGVQDVPVEVQHNTNSRDNADLSVRALLEVKDIVDEKLLKNDVDDIK